jgi:uncharacterized membrane protein YfcA
MDLALIPIFLALGAFVGFLAGLFGIGGGFTIVPVLVAVFTHARIDPAHVLPLAIGTSSASIVFTALASTRAHHVRGAVAWPIVWAMAPGLVVGSLIGPQIASALPSRIVAAIFGAVTWFAVLRTLRKPAVRATGELPGKTTIFGVGVGIGVMAGTVGTGAAFMAVPYLIRRKVTMHTAVATSAAIGLPIALAATLGFVFAGFGRADLPAWSAGYVYLPALPAIVVASMLLAPVGARVAHAWPVARLRFAFAAMLFLLGGYMWWRALAPAV